MASDSSASKMGTGCFCFKVFHIHSPLSPPSREADLSEKEDAELHLRHLRRAGWHGPLVLGQLREPRPARSILQFRLPPRGAAFGHDPGLARDHSEAEGRGGLGNILRLMKVEVYP